MKKVLSLLLCMVIVMSLVVWASALSTVAVKSIKLDNANISMYIGDSNTLKVTFTPANTTQKLLKFSSSSKNVAAVDANGKITASAEGKAVITVTSSSNSKVVAKCNVTVSKRKAITLTSFGSTDPDIDLLCGGDPGNTPIAKEISARLGINIKYIMASPQDAADKLKLMMSSGDVPDVFGAALDTDYPGGKSRALQEGLIAKVNPYLDTICKDYKNALNSNPEFMKNAQDDNGNIIGFAILKSPSSRTYGGPMIRKDLLQKAGISKLPVTIDDWYTDLKAIKSQGYTSPLTIQFWWKFEEGGFTGAYGTLGFFELGTDNKIHLGAMDEGYKQFLTTFSKWYKEGLIDPDYFTVADGALVNAKLTDMKTSGAALANVSRIQITNSNGKKIDPNFSMVGTQYPVLKAGDKPLYGQSDPPLDLRWYVSGRSKHIEDCMRYYNFYYSPEGQALTNWGLKDVTYTETNGVKKFTDMIPLTSADGKNPKGWTLDQSLKMYTTIPVDSVGVEDGPSFMAIRMTYPGQADAINNWTNFKLSYSLPNSLSYSKAELIVMKQQQNIVDAVRAWRAKFIMGNEPISKWDEYIKELQKLNVDDVLTVMNDAYERYQNRK